MSPFISTTFELFNFNEITTSSFTVKCTVTLAVWLPTRSFNWEISQWNSIGGTGPTWPSPPGGTLMVKFWLAQSCCHLFIWYNFIWILRFDLRWWNGTPRDQVPPVGLDTRNSVPCRFIWRKKEMSKFQKWGNWQ